MMIAGSSSGRPPKSVTWNGIRFEPLQEGQEQTITLDFTNWDGSWVYWTVVDTANNPIAGQLDTYYGQIYPGNGNSTQSFNFTFLADATTEGQLNYRIFVGSNPGSSDYIYQGIYNVNDSSKARAVYLDVDPASLGTMYPLTGWTDASGKSNNLYINGGSTSSDNGKVLVFNGSTTYVDDSGNPLLTNAVFGSVTVSAWIKPTAVNTTQTIISKELCYKLIINSNGTVGFMVGSANETSWTYTIYSDAGLVTAGNWAHVAAKVDVDSTKLYINGVEASVGGGVTLVANGQPFNIGTYSNGAGDFFNGRMGEVKLWNYGLNADDIADEYNATCSRYGLNPIPNSLTFVRSQSSYLKYDSLTSDWNLGDTYTIEWWARLNLSNYSNGSVYPVVCQDANTTNIDVFYNNGYIQAFNGEIKVAQPAAGTWHHVAVVKDGTTLTVYVNGHSRSIIAPIGNSTLSNGSLPLFVGARVNSSGVIYSSQVFDGELAGIRINNTALYTGTFTPERIPTAPSGTKLLLNGYNPWTDQSTSGHGQTGNNVTHTSAFPKLPATGGTGAAASSANGFTVTPSIAGRSDASTAYAGDTITWTITSNPGWGGYTMYYWVDGGALPGNTFVENSIDGGPISLDGNGSATFTRTVAQNVNMQFRMFIGHTLYQGGDYPFHGYIGV